MCIYIYIYMYIHIDILALPRCAQENYISLYIQEHACKYADHASEMKAYLLFQTEFPRSTLLPKEARHVQKTTQIG